MAGSELSKDDRNTQRYLYFDLAHTGSTEDFHYIDLAACLSAVNRRLYRQCRMYHVANISVHDTLMDDDGLEVRFTTAPNTWTTARAVRSAKKSWDEQIQNATEDLPDDAPEVQGKWADFKIYLSSVHKGDTTDRPKPIDCEGNEVQMYGTGSDNEWFYTAVQTRVSGTAYTNLNFVLLGGHNIANDGEIGVIKSLEDIWSQAAYDPLLPAAFDESPLLGMNPGPLKNEEILDAIMDENDQPPYSYLDMVGTDDNLPSPMTARETAITTAQNEMALVGGFPVPCGLLCVETKCGANNTVGILIELVPGTYKGVQSEAM